MEFIVFFAVTLGAVLLLDKRIERVYRGRSGRYRYCPSRTHRARSYWRGYNRGLKARQGKH